MRVAFRVDASSRIGTGHLMRCLTLADALKSRGALTRFICRHLPRSLWAQFSLKGHELVLLKSSIENEQINDLDHSHWLGVNQSQDAYDTLRALSDQEWNWLIVDHYALDVRWETILHQIIKKIMAIDDLADRQHDCDILLDQNYFLDMNKRYVKRVPLTCKVFLGPNYALLHPSYAELHEVIRPRDKVKRILVFFGGSDRDNLTGRAIEALLSLERDDIEVDVVLPIHSPYVEEIEQLAAGHATLKCHKALPTLAPLMASSDLAIGAMGATTWERLCLGLPTIAVTLAKNQTEVTAALHKESLVVWIGHSKTVTKESIAIQLMGIIKVNDLGSWSIRCMELCDGKGTNRIVEHLYLSMQTNQSGCNTTTC